MECPVCKKEMLEGCIPAEHTALEWHGECTVKLSRTPFLRAEKALAFYCPNCGHVLLPVQEIVSFADKMVNRLDAAAEKIQSTKEAMGKRLEEKRSQKDAEKRKGKDPWEM